MILDQKGLSNVNINAKQTMKNEVPQELSPPSMICRDSTKRL